MSTATEMTTEKKQITRNLGERDALLIEMNLPLDEFAALVKVTFDERWKQLKWRVQGDERLHYWIFDCARDCEQGMYSDAEVIKLAYERFLYIQAHQGQMNFRSVYVGDVEEVDIITPKNLDNVKVRIVKDCLDALYRYSTSYWLVNGGSGSAPSFHSNTAESRTDALLAGAREILAWVSEGWESRAEPDKYNPFINKIRNFIESVEAEIRQPSLFG